MTAGYGATHPGEQCHSRAASLPCPLGTAIGAHEVIARLEQAWAAWQYPDLSPTAPGGRLAARLSCTHAPAGSPRPWPRPAARSVVRPSSCSVIPSGCEQGKADYSNTSRLSRYGWGVAAASSGSGPLRTALAIPDVTATQDGSLNLMPSPLPQYPPAHAHVAWGAGSPHGWSARPRAHTVPMPWTCRPCRPTGYGGRATP
jgi:hypothetical protein